MRRVLGRLAGGVEVSDPPGTRLARVGPISKSPPLVGVCVAAVWGVWVRMSVCTSWGFVRFPWDRMQTMLWWRL